MAGLSRDKHAVVNKSLLRGVLASFTCYSWLWLQINLSVAIRYFVAQRVLFCVPWRVLFYKSSL